jgi:hypothetical protein
LSFSFLVIALLTEVRYSINVVLVCISSMTTNFEYFFMDLLISSSFENQRFNFFAHLKT